MFILTLVLALVFLSVCINSCALRLRFSVFVWTLALAFISVCVDSYALSLRFSVFVWTLALPLRFSVFVWTIALAFVWILVLAFLNVCMNPSLVLVLAFLSVCMDSCACVCQSLYGPLLALELSVIVIVSRRTCAVALPVFLWPFQRVCTHAYACAQCLHC